MAKQQGQKTVSHSTWLQHVTDYPMAWRETVIGLDWGEVDSAYGVVTYDGLVLDTGMVGETLPGVAELVALADQFVDPHDPTRRPPFVIEDPNRPLASALRQSGETVVAVAASTLAQQRARKGSRVAKSDTRDAVDLANITRQSPHKAHLTGDHAADSIEVGFLFRENRHAQRELVTAANRVRSCLAQFNPGMLRVVKTREIADLATVRALLRAAPTFHQAQSLSLDDVIGIAQAHQRTRSRLTGERLWRGIHQQDVPVALPAEVEAIHAAHLLRLVDAVESAAHRAITLRAKLDEAVATHPDTALFRDSKGCGPVSRAGLVATALARFDEFEDVRGFLAYAAVVPTVKQSGGHVSHSRRDNLATDVARAAWMWADGARKHHPVAEMTYWRFRAEGCKHPTAVRKIGARLMRGLYHCRKYGQVWDDSAVWRTDLSAEEVAMKTEEFRAVVEAKRNSAQKAKIANRRVSTLAELQDQATATSSAHHSGVSDDTSTDDESSLLAGELIDQTDPLDIDLGAVASREMDWAHVG